MTIIVVPMLTNHKDIWPLFDTVEVYKKAHSL